MLLSESLPVAAARDKFRDEVIRQEFFHHGGHGVHGENNLGFSVFSVYSVVSFWVWLAPLPVSGRIGGFAGILDLTNVAPRVRLRPVQIGETIHLCELPTR